MQTFQFELGGRQLVVETGKYAKQANGAGHRFPEPGHCGV